MSSAAEVRFRLRSQPPTARTITVAALDSEADALVVRLAAQSWNGVSFLCASDALRDVSAVARADLVVMLTTAGAEAHAAALIGQACSARRVPTATFVLRAPSATEAEVSLTLGQIRPWSLMVLVASDEEFVDAVLRSFR